MKNENTIETETGFVRTVRGNSLKASGLSEKERKQVRKEKRDRKINRTLKGHAY